MHRNWLLALLTINFMVATPAFSEVPKLSMPQVSAGLIDPQLRQQATELEQQFQNSSVSASALREVLGSASDTIEALALQGDFAIAHKVCKAKLETARRGFGEKSGPVLDALQDQIFLSSQRKDYAQMRQLMMEYASIAATMQQQDKQSEIEMAEHLRAKRLKNKLDSAMSTLFQPL